MSGHAWVFSNEVDIASTPLTAFSPGALAQLQDNITLQNELGIRSQLLSGPEAAEVVPGLHASSVVGAAWGLLIGRSLGLLALVAMLIRFSGRVPVRA